MAPTRFAQRTVAPHTRECFRRALVVLRDAQLPYLVGGAYAFGHYTGIERHTKDLDIFVRRDDCARALAILSGAGYRTELLFKHWIGKAYCGDDLIDVIFGSGNGFSPIDDAWFTHATEAVIFDVAVKLCPPEEIIWQKAFVMEHLHYDGADIAHLLRARGARLDWERLLQRFGPHWRVLLSSLTLFGFIYPDQRALVPAWVLDELIARLQHETRDPPPPDRVCQGTLLSLMEYLVDLDRLGYQDARLALGYMTPEDLHEWTAAFLKDQ